eukprot:4732676-Prymnesium_polylepis.1
MWIECIDVCLASSRWRPAPSVRKLKIQPRRRHAASPVTWRLTLLVLSSTRTSCQPRSAPQGARSARYRHTAHHRPLATGYV